MSNSAPPPDPSSQSTDAASTGNKKVDPNPPTPLRCFTGAVIAGGIAFVLYSLTSSIVQTFANKPLPSGSYLATNIAVAVRTLVMGMSALATGIFGIAALGLVALGIQLLVQQLRQPST